MWKGWFSAVCPVHIIWIYGCQDSLLRVSQHSKVHNIQSSGSSVFILFCFPYLNIKLQDSSVKRAPCCPAQPCLTQIPPPEPDDTLRQQRTAADALWIDSVFRVVVDRVSTKRGEEGVTRPGKDPEGEQLLMAQKIHFIMETYWHWFQVWMGALIWLDRHYTAPLKNPNLIRLKAWLILSSHENSLFFFKIKNNFENYFFTSTIEIRIKTLYVWMMRNFDKNAI